MKTYTDRTTAPLIFHTLERYVRAPLSAIISAGFSIWLTYQMIMVSFWYSIDLFFYVMFFATSATIFFGCMKWKPCAWYAIMIDCVIFSVYNFLPFFLPGSVDNDMIDVLIAFFRFFLMGCIVLYYLKRKPLFFNASQTPEQPSTEALPQEPIPSPVNPPSPPEKPAPKEETPVEETSIEETSIEETPIEETPVEETSIEETTAFKLFQQIQNIAECLCDDTTIFPDGATLKDKEVSYVYAYFVYSTSNMKNNYVGKEIFLEALTYIRLCFQLHYKYTDAMLEDMYILQKEKLDCFYSIQKAYLEPGQGKESNLWAYTREVIAQFPSVSPDDAYSAALIFSAYFAQILDDIQKFAEDVSLDLAKEPEAPPQQQKPEPQPKKQKNWSVPCLWFGVVALFCALVVSSNDITNKDAQIYALQSKVNGLEGQLRAAEITNKVEVDLADNTSLSHRELDFVEKYAVYITNYDDYFHDFSCSRAVREESTFIYDRFLAEAEDYLPCPTCNP